MSHRRLLRAYVTDPAERAIATFVEQFVWVLIGASSTSLMLTQNYLYAADAAGFAAAASLLTSVLTFWVKRQPPMLDLGLRVLKTFLQSVLGSMAADKAHTLSGVSWTAALALALPVAMTAGLKGAAVLALPWTAGASLLPARPGPTPPEPGSELVAAPPAERGDIPDPAALDYPPPAPTPALAGGEQDHPAEPGAPDPDATYHGPAVTPTHGEAGLALVAEAADEAGPPATPEPVQAGTAAAVAVAGAQPS